MDEDDEIFRDLSDMLAHESDGEEEDDDDVEEEEEDDGAKQEEQARRVMASSNFSRTKTKARRTAGGKFADREAAEDAKRAAAVRAGDLIPAEAHIRCDGTFTKGASRRPKTTAEMQREEARAQLAEAALAAASDQPLKYREMETDRLRKMGNGTKQKAINSKKPLSAADRKGRGAIPPRGKGNKGQRDATLDDDEVAGAGGAVGFHVNGPVQAIYHMSNSAGNHHSQSVTAARRGSSRRGSLKRSRRCIRITAPQNGLRQQPSSRGS